jgi:hypothetical protein
MLRGEVDVNIDRFSELEKVYARNLDDWMFNLYFSIRKLKTTVDEKFAVDLFPDHIDATLC